MGKKAKRNEPKPRELTWTLGNFVELIISPMQAWDALKGEAIQHKFWQICNKQSLVNSKGLTIGQVERTGSVRLIKDSVSGKQYFMGDVKCAYKLLIRSRGYFVDANEFMEQEVEAILDGGEQVREVEMTTPQPVLVGTPTFSFIRIHAFTLDGVSLPHQVVKAGGGHYKIIFTRIWKHLYPNLSWSREILKNLIHQHFND